MIAGGRYLLLALKEWVSGMCRLPPPTTRLSVSPSGLRSLPPEITSDQAMAAIQWLD
jgi:hypothetical protein